MPLEYRRKAVGNEQIVGMLRIIRLRLKEIYNSNLIISAVDLKRRRTLHRIISSCIQLFDAPRGDESARPPTRSTQIVNDCAYAWKLSADLPLAFLNQRPRRYRLFYTKRT